MTKSIQDYRNIVKVLKLQLLKVREENTSLSNQLGIVSQSQTSSFTPKLKKYQDSKKPFAKNICIFLQFAHRCELIKISPQMIFRIADKSRDKKVSVKSIAQIMKRLKLRMTDIQIDKLLNLITKSNNIIYEQYLQFLSAFQINCEKYPADSSRTFFQQCLIKFGQQNKEKYKVGQLYRKINNDQDKPYFQFDNLKQFRGSNMKNLTDIELVAIFVGLDIQSQCQIQKTIFQREMEKVYSLIDRGLVDDNYVAKSKIKGKKQIIHQESQDENDFKQETQTGVQKGNTKKTTKKPDQPAKKQSKLPKSGTNKIVDILRKEGISSAKLIQQLIKKQKKRQEKEEIKINLVRSFSLSDFSDSVKLINPKIQKKVIMTIFKAFDTENNGSVSTEELLKLWLRGKDMTDKPYTMYQLLYRHFRQIQFIDPLLRFINLGYKEDTEVTQDILSQAFQQLNLSKQEIYDIKSQMENKVKIKQLAELLKSQGKIKLKQFEKMNSKQFDKLSAISKKLNSKNKDPKNFKKLLRLQTGQKDTSGQIWETIFTDQWACWDYCLNIAAKLQNFWRDPEFGPTKADVHGYRSIVGNISEIPPGLPDQQDIQWLTYEQILEQNKIKQKVVFMSENLQSTDVVQGKLGNCWYVSALSIIANDDTFIKGKSLNKKPIEDNLVYGIHPIMFHKFKKYGLYVFKFFNKFTPVYVIVDDLFPVQTSTKQLIFAKSPNPGLQWVSFAEKAYAKLHHSYSNMISGDIAQGLNDLTNALPLKQSLQNQNPENKSKLKRLNQEKQLMGCSISAPKGAGVQQPVTLDDQRCGLFYGHAYSIIDYLELLTSDKNQFDLMRVRNPWGHGQWALDWSDKPVDDYPQYQKLNKYQKDLDKFYQKKISQAKQNREQPPTPYKPGDDGQFLMNFDDWNKIYSNLFTGIFFRSQYFGQFINQKWDSSVPSGLCKSKGATQKDRSQFVLNNHQYVIDLKQQTDILMFLIQEDGRLYRGQKYPYKELVNASIILVFNLKKDESQLKLFDKEKMTDPNNLKLQVRRDVSFWYKFKPGKYAIIPCKMQNTIAQSQFEFRVYSDKQIAVKKMRKGNNNFKPLLQRKGQPRDQSALNSIADIIQKGQI